MASKTTTATAVHSVDQTLGRTQGKEVVAVPVGLEQQHGKSEDEALVEAAGSSMAAMLVPFGGRITLGALAG